MTWTPGDVSGSQVLEPRDHLHADHINELRVAVTPIAAITAFGSSLIDDADAAAARATLGLGSAAVISDGTLMHLAGAETVTGAKTFNAGLFLDKGNYSYDAAAYLAVGDGKTVSDAAITTGTPNLTSATAAFAPTDAGKIICVFGAGAAGVPLSATIQNYVSATQVTLSVNASTSVSGARIDWGTNNTTFLQNAINAVPSTSGGKVWVKPGVYLINARVDINRSNFELELAPGAIIRAAAQIGVASGRRGMINIEKSTVGATQSNVYIHGGTLDTNNQVDSVALSMWGAGNDTSIWTLSDVTIEKVSILNQARSSNVSGQIVMRSGQVGGAFSIGRIKDVSVRNCIFDTTDIYFVDMNGDYFNNIAFDNNIFRYSQQGSIKFDGYIVRTWDGLAIRHNKFYHTKLASSASSLCDINDASRTGGKNLWITCNEMTNEGDTLRVDTMLINIHGWHSVFILDNDVHDGWQFCSFGQSLSGSAWTWDGCRDVTIIGNKAWNLDHAFDNDATTRFNMAHNQFSEFAGTAYSGYSVHEHSIIEQNTFHNMNRKIEDATYASTYWGIALSALSEYAKAAIEMGSRGDRRILRNNTVIDDHLLQDPGAAPPTLSQVAGGALSGRTYYVKYSYANDSGETLVSTESSLVVSANNLLKVAIPSPPGYASTFESTTGIRTINVYVGTSSGAETLQGQIDYPTMTMNWTEPTTGLVAGASMPVANTTHAICKYGIFALANSHLIGKDDWTGNRIYGTQLPYATDDQTGFEVNLRDNWYNDTPLPDNAPVAVFGTDIKTELAPPPPITLVASGVGGSLATGTYWYRVTALDNLGESRGSVSKSVAVTGPTGKVTVSWTAVPGASSYRVYRGTDQNLESVYYTSSASPYVDTGSVGTAGTVPNLATAYLNKIAASGSSWIRAGNFQVGTGTPTAPSNPFEVNRPGAGSTIVTMIDGGVRSTFSSAGGDDTWDTGGSNAVINSGSQIILKISDTAHLTIDNGGGVTLTGALTVASMTTTQRDALTAVNGMIIYNTTAGKFQGREAGAWVNLI